MAAEGPADPPPLVVPDPGLCNPWSPYRDRDIAMPMLYLVAARVPPSRHSNP